MTAAVRLRAAAAAVRDFIDRAALRARYCEELERQRAEARAARDAAASERDRIRRDMGRISDLAETRQDIAAQARADRDDLRAGLATDHGIDVWATDAELRAGITLRLAEAWAEVETQRRRADAALDLLDEVLSDAIRVRWDRKDGPEDGGGRPQPYYPHAEPYRTFRRRALDFRAVAVPAAGGVVDAVIVCGEPLTETRGFLPHCGEPAGHASPHRRARDPESTDVVHRADDTWTSSGEPEPMRLTCCSRLMQEVASPDDYVTWHDDRVTCPGASAAGPGTDGEHCPACAAPVIAGGSYRYDPGGGLHACPHAPAEPEVAEDERAHREGDGWPQPQPWTHHVSAPELVPSADRRPLVQDNGVVASAPDDPAADPVGTVRVHPDDDPAYPGARRYLLTDDGVPASWARITGRERETLRSYKVRTNAEDYRTSGPRQSLADLARVLGHPGAHVGYGRARRERNAYRRAYERVLDVVRAYPQHQQLGDADLADWVRAVINAALAERGRALDVLAPDVDTTGETLDIVAAASLGSARRCAAAVTLRWVLAQEQSDADVPNEDLDRLREAMIREVLRLNPAGVWPRRGDPPPEPSIYRMPTDEYVREEWARA